METIKYTKISNETVSFNYSGHSFTINLDDPNIISSDDDGSATFDPAFIIGIDESLCEFYI